MLLPWRTHVHDSFLADHTVWCRASDRWRTIPVQLKMDSLIMPLTGWPLDFTTRWSLITDQIRMFHLRINCFVVCCLGCFFFSIFKDNSYFWLENNWGPSLTECSHWVTMLRHWSVDVSLVAIALSKLIAVDCFLVHELGTHTQSGFIISLYTLLLL